jgi:hypothetical protein
MRALFNKDIATGLESTGEGSNYSSQGPSDTLAHRNEQFEQPLQFCYTLDPGSTCTEEQIEALLEGNGTVCRYIVKDKNSTALFPELMGRLEDEGCGKGSGSGNGTGNGTVGGGNGTVGGGVPAPSEGGAGRIAVSVWMMVVGLLAFAVL